MNCPTCKAVDWVKNDNGMLCDVCFTFIPLSYFNRKVEEEKMQRNVEELLEEFHDGHENSWS